MTPVNEESLFLNFRDILKSILTWIIVSPEVYNPKSSRSLPIAIGDKFVKQVYLHNFSGLWEFPYAARSPITTNAPMRILSRIHLYWCLDYSPFCVGVILIFGVCRQTADENNYHPSDLTKASNNEICTKALYGIRWALNDSST